jgi:hypothetical protein
MSHYNEHPSNTDPMVSAAYSAIATETAPARLDDIVLRSATEEARATGGFARYFYTIRRPLAFAATLVLALSIVLQFDSLITGQTPLPSDGVAEYGNAATSASDISAVIDASAEHIQEQSQQGERVRSQGLLNQPMPETDRFCSSEQTVSPGLWWVCITELDKIGRYAAAAAERELLTNTYPDFSPAE